MIITFSNKRGRMPPLAPFSRPKPNTLKSPEIITRRVQPGTPPFGLESAAKRPVKTVFMHPIMPLRAAPLIGRATALR